jgi:hypothetical protein
LPDWITDCYAPLKAGAVINPINIVLTPEELKFVAPIVEHAGCLLSWTKGTRFLVRRRTRPPNPLSCSAPNDRVRDASTISSVRS